MSATNVQWLQELREAATNNDWDGFRDTLSAWRGEEQDNEWLTAGIHLAHSLVGDDVSDDDREALRKIDQRAFEQVSALDSLRSGGTETVRDMIADEISRNPRDSAWLSAYRCVIGETDDPENFLFTLEQLVAGCVMRDSQIQSMAERDSKTPAETLGDHTDRMWDELEELSNRVGLGAIRGVRALADDGAWVVVSDGQDPPKLASVVVSSPEAMNETVARAYHAIEGPEAGE